MIKIKNIKTLTGDKVVFTAAFKTRNVILVGLLLIILTSLFACTTCNNCSNNSTRDYMYEAYCDSIWENNPDYYLDCLVESNEYQQYIEQHGYWWE